MDTATASRQELIREAGKLNNHPALVNTDHVTIMGMFSRDECAAQVEYMRKLVRERV